MNRKRKWYEKLSYKDHARAVSKTLKPSSIAGVTTSIATSIIGASTSGRVMPSDVAIGIMPAISTGILLYDVHRQETLGDIENRNNRSATTIQKVARGHLARKQYKTEKLYKNIKDRVGNGDVLEKLKKASQEEQLMSR